MLKPFCDKCGKEIDEDNPLLVGGTPGGGDIKDVAMMGTRSFDGDFENPSFRVSFQARVKDRTLHVCKPCALGLMREILDQLIDAVEHPPSE